MPDTRKDSLSYRAAVIAIAAGLTFGILTCSAFAIVSFVKRIERQASPGHYIEGVHFSADNRILVGVGGYRTPYDLFGEIYFWDTSSGRCLVYNRTDAPIERLAVMQNGRILATAGNKSNRGDWISEVHLWDPMTGQLLHHLKPSHREEITDIFPSPDGKSVLTRSAFRIEIWSISSGKRTASWTRPAGRNGWINGCTFVAQNRYLLVTTNSDLSDASKGSTELWDAANGALVTTLLEPTKNHHSVDVSYNGDYAVVAERAKKGQVVLWDLMSRKVVGRFRPPTSEWLINSVDFQPTGKTVRISVSVDREDHRKTLIWDVSQYGEFGRAAKEAKIASLRKDAYLSDDGCLAAIIPPRFGRRPDDKHLVQLFNDCKKTEIPVQGVAGR